MENETYLLASADVSAIEAMTPEGTVIPMLRLHLWAHPSGHDQSAQPMTLPVVAMTPDAALALAQGLRERALAMQRSAGGPPSGLPPAQSLN